MLISRIGRGNIFGVAVALTLLSMGCSTDMPVAPTTSGQSSGGPTPSSRTPSMTPEEANIFDMCNVQGEDMCHASPLQYSSLTSNTPSYVSCPLGCHTFPIYDTAWEQRTLDTTALFRNELAECSWAKPYIVHMLMSGNLRYFSRWDGGPGDIHYSNTLTTPDYKAQIHLNETLFDAGTSASYRAEVIFHEAAHGYKRMDQDAAKAATDQCVIHNI